MYQGSGSKFIGLALASGAFLLSPAGASAAPFPLSQYDLVVLGNLNSSSEVDGAAWIGGNLGGPASNYATKLSGSASTITLAVGGNVSANPAQVENGSATVGGSITGSVLTNQAGATVSHPTPINPSVADMTAALDGASNFFAGLTSNATVSLPGAQPGPATFNANNLTQAVFSINASDLFGNTNVQQIQLSNDSSTQSIIINVLGTTVSDSGNGNFVGDFTSSSTQAKVIWNFVNATSINISNRFEGALLAPNAALTNSSDIDGAVGVASIMQNAEIHLPLSTVPTPEPVCGSMMILGAMTLMRRRQFRV